ncbi:MAG: ankyrin repeat domain-containing protein [Gammaproteobacteria bacterium]|nr:ankyrin repeat domain-containing protein [Gammaproteobacteria bacterium]
MRKLATLALTASLSLAAPLQAHWGHGGSHGGDEEGEEGHAGWGHGGAPQGTGGWGSGGGLQGKTGWILPIDSEAGFVEIINDRLLVWRVDTDLRKPARFMESAIYLIGRYFPRGAFDFVVFFIPWFENHSWAAGQYYGNATMHAENGSEEEDLVGQVSVTWSDAGSVLSKSDTLNHELLHKWAAKGVPSGCVGSDGWHWGFASANGVLGGYDKNTLEDMGDGVYMMDRFSTLWGMEIRLRFSPIELYSMGLATADEVPDLQCLVNARWHEDRCYQDDEHNWKCKVRADGVSNHTAEQYLQSVSQDPSTHTHAAQTERKNKFRVLGIAPVFMSGPNFNDVQIKSIARMLERYEDPVTQNFVDDGFISFYEATGGRATVKTGIEDVFMDSGEERHCSDLELCPTVPLIGAAVNGDVDLARVLIERGADLEAKDSKGQTALWWAVGFSPDMARVLIEAGADVNTKNNTGWTPLHRVWWVPDLARALIEAGADLEAKENSGWTPLHWVAFQNGADVARVLIAAGADVNAKNNTGRTPLHQAAWTGALNAARVLIAAGADVNAKDNSGETPLDLAVVEGAHSEVAQLLRDAGAEESEE